MISTSACAPFCPKARASERACGAPGDDSQDGTGLSCDDAELRSTHSLFLEQRLAGTRLAARLMLRVANDPVFDLGFGLVVQILIGRPCIGELSVSP